MEFKICCWLLTVGGEGGSTKINLLTVVDGRRGERVEKLKCSGLLTNSKEEGGLKKTKLLTVDDCRD